MILQNITTSDQDKYDFGFLLVLLVLVIISFLLFYFGIPMVTDLLIKVEATQPLSSTTGVV